MNIFFLDFDVKKCAEYHCDKHVVKMILETAQLLCSVHHVTDQERPSNRPSTDQVPYKLSHKNHPCAIWTRESLSNYLYLCELGLELCKEYTYRYDKIHKCERVGLVRTLLTLPKNIVRGPFQEPPPAMPDQYKTTSSIQSYMNYYKGSKKEFATWKRRKTPEWFN